jgi:zinc transporter ZupT
VARGDILAAILGSVLFANASPEVAGILDAVSGGILLAMAVESMIPEAFDRTPLFSGTIAALGFATITALSVLVYACRLMGDAEANQAPYELLAADIKRFPRDASDPDDL